MHIIGTAGHVDHGKSTLVTALTGTNPDRWIEEQRRGMTLDLGFAHLRFDDGSEAGIVDVPGHERFLHNMLAGAAGMELLLLVIAANEGIMPQTIEHLNILRYLNVARVVVALTKMDLIEPSRAGAICQETHRALAGTIAEDAPIFAVSVTSGANIDALKLGLAQELAALPQRDTDAPAYLPIDRVFTLPGRGTIVTGTLMQGRIATGDTLSLQPLGEAVRVRSLQVFGKDRESATGGTRVALNLAGVDKSAIKRGDVLADPRFEARTSYSVEFEPLAEAIPFIRRRLPVRAHIGSSEVLGTLVEGTLHLREPVLAFPGVRFVLRRVTPKTLLGGGKIKLYHPEHSEAESRGESHLDSVESTILALLRASETPLDLEGIAYAANVREAVAAGAVEALITRGDALRIDRPSEYISDRFAAKLASAIEVTLAELHESEPWAMGATSLALCRTLSVPEPLLVRVLAAFAHDGRIAARAGYYSLPSHQPKLSAAQREFFENEMPVDPEQPLLPAEFAAVVNAVKHSAVAGLSKAFDTLLARGTLVKVGDSLYRGTQIAEVHARVERFLNAHGRMSMAEFRDILQTSRKYAVPLLEWFDGRGITVRDGDYRALRSRGGERLPVV